MKQSMAASFLALSTWLSFASAHMILTYPGTRGDNLHTNGTVNTNDYETSYFPYGMQWMYPCGGLKMTTNRTYWPIGGGAVAWQPGWFPGHSKAFTYINLGINPPDGSAPPNYSHVMQPAFAIKGPTNNAYPGLAVCLPQVPTPANLTFYEGQNATIQIVEAAQHGAALFACVDITFTNNMSLVEEVNEDNCKNDTQIEFDQIFITESLRSGAWSNAITPQKAGAMTAVALATVMWTVL